MEVVAEAGLVGRDAELERLERVFASLGEGAAAAVLCGGAGIGKTALWRAAAARAEAAGARVLLTRCAEVEMPIAFGGLADLLEAAVDAAAAAALPAAQLRVLTAAFGRTETVEPPDRLALASAVRTTLCELAAGSPLLVAVDDLQWLDPGSRRVLAWALRRVGPAPVGLLATLRDDAPEQDPLALADALAAGRFARIDLGPLSAGALQHMVAARVGVHLPRPTLVRLQRASGGNPLFALEFARMVAAGGIRPVGPLEVPPSLEQLVRARIAALPRRLRPLLELVAALERATLPLLDRALVAGDAELLAEQAMQAELLVQDEDGVVRFSHPLLASGVYFGMPPRARRALHGRLAGVVETLEERGRHAALATARSDATTASLVAEAAAAAAARGALDAAAQLADEAARLTPSDDSDAKRRRRLAAASWLAEIGEFAQARARLDELLGVEQPAELRAEALFLRAECELADRHALVALLREALAAAAQPRLRWRALIRLAHHGGWISGDVPGAAETAGEALDVAVEIGEAPLVELSLAALAYYRAALGFDDVPRPRRRGRPAPPPRMQWWQLAPAVSRGCRLMWAGELDRARSTLEEGYEEEERAGRLAKAAFVLCSLSELEWRAGDWARADALAREATERLGDVNPTAYPRALAAAGAGRVEEASATAEGALAWAAANDEHVAPPRFRWLLGLLELSRGDAARAHGLLEAAQADLDSCGIREPGYLPVLPDLLEALVALDRLDEAEGLLGRLDAAAGHRWAVPAAQRSRALLLLARRDTEAAVVLAGAAAAAFAAIGMPLEHARSLLVSGNALRRAGRRQAAAEPLTEAARIFARLGAPLWLEQAERELRRAKPRRSRDRDELTAAERRVAALVAAGRKNKEVAAELYTTVGTVEAHLTRIYRKLGIRSRAELVRRVADGALRDAAQP